MSFFCFLLLLLLFDFSFCFLLLLLLLQQREMKRELSPRISFSQKKEKKFFLVSSDLHTRTHKRKSKTLLYREEEEEDKEEEVHPQNVSIWRRRRPKRKQQSFVSVRSAIQSLPGLVHRPLGVGQRGQNHPTTERVGQIVATRRLGFPDVVQR